mgnify:CR=1 FL=1
MEMRTVAAAQRCAQLGGAVARAARAAAAAAGPAQSLPLATLRPYRAMLPGSPQHQRAAARLGRLLSSLSPRTVASAAAGESVGAGTTAAPPPPAAAPPKQQPPLASGYRLPPKEIADIVDTPPEPLLSFSPNRELVMQLARPPGNPPISELARPELKLAGERAVPPHGVRWRRAVWNGSWAMR